MKNEKIMEILTKGEYGVLSTIREDGRPMGIPLNYVWMNEALYFHCATEGEKLDSIRKNPHVSFTVVGSVKILDSKFSTQYESVIAEGNAVIVDGAEKIEALQGLVKKYSPQFIEEGQRYIASSAVKTTVVKIKVSSLSGKARTE